MPLVSLIMPVYNVEDYIVKSIRSVLEQTFRDFELFVVDDGSTDRSGALCDEFAREDARVIPFHQVNQGSSAARNNGLDHASGKYVYFIDADDWIGPNRLENLVQIAEKEQADLVITGFSMEYYLQGREITYHTPCPSKVYSDIDVFHREAYQYLNNSLLSLPWNKLFLRQRIEAEHIRFQKTKWPDHHFCMDYLMNCQKVVLNDAEDYHWYRSRKNSSTDLIYADVRMFNKRVEHYEHVLRLFEHWGVDDAKSIDAISAYFIGRVMQCVQEISINRTIGAQERRDRIKAMVNHPLVLKASKHTGAMSSQMRLMTFPIRHRSIPLCMMMGKGISAVRTYFPGLFVHLKEKEVHEN